MSVHTFKRATVNDTVNRGLSAYGSKVDNSMCACPECEGLGGTGFMKCENCKGTGKVLNEKYKGWTIKRDGEGYTILDANGDEAGEAIELADARDLVDEIQKKEGKSNATDICPSCHKKKVTGPYSQTKDNCMCGKKNDANASRLFDQYCSEKGITGESDDDAEKLTPNKILPWLASKGIHGNDATKIMDDWERMLGS